MTTMPQRLREIAAMAHYAMLVHERILVADSLRAIAAELEAHAADEVPVVASLAQKQDAKLPYEIIEAIDRLCISWSRRDCKGQPRVDARQVLQDVVCSVIASREARIAEHASDGEMLDWLVRKGTMHVGGSDARGWMVSDMRNGLVILSRGHATYRDAIRAAMKGTPS